MMILIAGNLATLRTLGERHARRRWSFRPAEVRLLDDGRHFVTASSAAVQFWSSEGGRKTGAAVPRGVALRHGTLLMHH